MKVVDSQVVVAGGGFSATQEWADARAAIVTAVQAVDWPPGSGTFTIRPERHANGVPLIKAEFVASLKAVGWVTETPINLTSDLQPGNLDFMLTTSQGPIAIEWETGNVSSCHRSMNKLCLGLSQGVIRGGVMCVASRVIYPWLTDRIGNWTELQPYIPLWSQIHVANGILEVLVFEHDATSPTVAVIPKGVDGNAKAAAAKAAKVVAAKVAAQRKKAKP